MINERQPEPDKMKKELLDESNNEPEDHKSDKDDSFMEFKDVLKFSSEGYDIELYSNRTDTRGLATVLMRLLKWVPRLEAKKKKITRYVG
jgi:hypothetical protein